MHDLTKLPSINIEMVSKPTKLSLEVTFIVCVPATYVSLSGVGDT